jgi:small-conductance mechanosensitive channel
MGNFETFLTEFIQIYAAPLIKSVLAILAGLFLYQLVRHGLKKIAENGFLDFKLRIMLRKLAKWLIVVIVLLLCLGFFGLSVNTLWATLTGVLALIALGFVAVWSVLSNVLCSILMIIFPPFRIGDQIEIQEPSANFSVKGKVVDANMLFTTLEASSDTNNTVDSILRVPNNIFFQKYVRVIPGATTESLQTYTARHQDKNQKDSTD